MESKLNRILKSLTVAQQEPYGCCSWRIENIPSGHQKNIHTIEPQECLINYDWTTQSVCSGRYGSKWRKEKHALSQYQCGCGAPGSPDLPGGQCVAPGSSPHVSQECCCHHDKCCTIGSCCSDGNCSQGYITECTNPLENWRPDGCNYGPGGNDRCIGWPSLFRN